MIRRHGSDTGTVRNKYKVYFFTIALMVDLLLSVLLCFIYSFFQFQKTANSSIAQMKQVCASADLLYESMEAIVTQMQTDSDTNTFLISSQVNRLQEADVGKKIRSIRTATPSIRYITLYNADTRRFVSTAAAGYNEMLEIETLYEALGRHPSACLFRSVGENTNIQSKKNSQVYTFIFSVNRKNDKAGNLVIIDVNKNYFDKALSPICVKEKDHYIVLRSSAEDVISVMSSGAGSSSFTTVTGDDSISLKYSDSEQSGYYFSKYYGKHKFITFARAALTGWTFYSVLPFNYPLEGLIKMLIATLILSASMLILGYALSSRASETLYAPIKRLYENYVSPGEDKSGNELDLISDAFHEIYSKTDRLEQGLAAAYRDSRNLYLNYLLNGEKRKVESSLEVYKQLNINLSSPSFVIILIESMAKQSSPSVNGKGLRPNQFISQYAYTDNIQEKIRSYCEVELLQTDENRFALLLYLESSTFPKELEQILKDVSNTLQQNLSLETTVCIGNIVSAWRDINLSYEQALIALGSCTVEYYGTVFYSQALPETVTINAQQYFNGLHARLTGLIRADDLDSCSKELDFALISAQSTSFRSVRSHFRHVLMSVLDDFPDLFKKDNDIFIQLIKQLENFDHCHNVQSLKENSMNFLSLLNIHVHANRKNKNVDLAQDTQKYIDENYADPNLSLQMIAPLMNCSPAYLGKTFTAVTTFSFNDYLNNIRMEKAAELLLSTKDPVRKISEEVGIYNTNYFYSLFKKKYGMTPSAYRKAGD